MPKRETELCPCLPPSSIGAHRVSAPPVGKFKCCGQELYAPNPQHPRFRRCAVCAEVYWLRPLDPDTGESRAEVVSEQGVENLRAALIL